MREIKFRAWNKKINWITKDGSLCSPQMEYDGFVINPKYGLCEFPEGGWDLQGQPEDPENFILMQYTGLKDKHGKEIYESDVVKYKGLAAKNGRQIYPDKIIIVDDFVKKTWNLRNLIDCGKNHLEIIGNIYENPGLI